MRREFSLRVEAARVRDGIDGLFASGPGEHFGMFDFHGPCGEPLHVIVSPGHDPMALGWEHVSVSTRRRMPNWIEMSWVKDLFWDDEACVVQYHPRKSQYVNMHKYTLHMWRRIEGFPEPPSIAVGVKGVELPV
jgi:hypothetical protein